MPAPARTAFDHPAAPADRGPVTGQASVMGGARSAAIASGLAAAMRAPMMPVARAFSLRTA